MTFELIETFNGNESHRETFIEKRWSKIIERVEAMYPNYDILWESVTDLPPEGIFLEGSFDDEEGGEYTISIQELLN